MANQFSKEERVAFDKAMEGFEDGLVISNQMVKMPTDAVSMERSNDILWVPAPYIMNSYDGSDQTANFSDVAQLSVPARINIWKSAPFALTSTELRDALQEGSLGEGARQKLASDINVACNNLAALQGTIVIKRTSAANGFDDVAAEKAALDRVGIPRANRWAAYSPDDWNGMASNLAARQTVDGKVLTAYEEAYINKIAGINVLSLDYGYFLAAAAGVTVTVNGANQYYTPAATTTDANGGGINVDNRYQNLAVTVTSGTIKVGDAFTIAGVNEVHHITKQNTGKPKTFRVTGIVTGAGGTGTIQISPPIISATGATRSELMYQNVNAAPATGAAITWLNTVANYANPFWNRDAIQLLPGTTEIPDGAGVATMLGTTSNGIQIRMSKQTDINTLRTKYRFDTRFGVTALNPEMMGIELFSQT